MDSPWGKIEAYQTRSEELRVIAEGLKDADAKRLVLELAEHYERLAATLEKRKKD